MDVKYSYSRFEKIKVFLVFFYLILPLGCRTEEQVGIEQIDYEDEKAVGVTFTANMGIEKLRVFVGEESEVSVIGVIVSIEDKHQFSPVIPFTPGQRYTIRKEDSLVLASFAIPQNKTTTIPEVVRIYPELDTVPENVLKMYILFSEPMQQIGHALDFITVTDESDGTDIAPFLKLESELWNADRTLLTLWVEPGRIKTDLIPNRERGLPLKNGKNYTMTIDSSWKSRKGVSLKNGHTKTFWVGKRDDQKPQIEMWRLQESDSTNGLELDFGEPMDAFLARETIRFYDMEGREIKGRRTLLSNQSQLHFIPEGVWPDDEIEIRVEVRLEDLAGNNLVRRFDMPLIDEKPPMADSVEIVRFTYQIRPE